MTGRSKDWQPEVVALGQLFHRTSRTTAELAGSRSPSLELQAHFWKLGNCKQKYLLWCGYVFTCPPWREMFDNIFSGSHLHEKSTVSFYPVEFTQLSVIFSVKVPLFGPLNWGAYARRKAKGGRLLIETRAILPSSSPTGDSLRQHYSSWDHASGSFQAYRSLILSPEALVVRNE